MINLIRVGQAGTLESSDIMIIAMPGEQGSGIQIQLSSPVIKQFGRQIKATIELVSQELGVVDVVIQANDRGALDCTIKARVKAALYRGIKEENL